MLKAIYFSNDAILFLDNNPSTDHTSQISSEIAQGQTWIKANKLSLKVQKIEYRINSNKNQVENINNFWVDNL